jgi:hypothetical protein
MRSSDLRAPLVFEIAARLIAQGYLPGGGTLPRSREALLELLDHAAMRLMESN